jgi:hypothetical protein
VEFGLFIEVVDFEEIVDEIELLFVASTAEFA